MYWSRMDADRGNLVFAVGADRLGEARVKALRRVCEELFLGVGRLHFLEPVDGVWEAVRDEAVQGVLL